MRQEPHDEERDDHDRRADQEHEVHGLGETDEERFGQSRVELADERGVAQRFERSATAGVCRLEAVDEVGVDLRVARSGPWVLQGRLERGGRSELGEGALNAASGVSPK